MKVSSSQNFFFSLILMVMSFSFSSRAFAEGAGGGGAGGGAGGRYEAFMSAGDLGIGKSATEIDLSPGVQLIPFPTFSWLQVGGEIAYQKISYMGSSSTNLLLLVGPTANIGASLTDSFFISLGMALRSGSASLPDNTVTDPNGFGFYFFAGKRFPIGGSLSMRPSLGVVSCGTTGMVFRPFAVSYTF